MTIHLMYSGRRFFQFIYFIAIAVLFLLLTSCSDNGTSIEEPQNVEQVSDFLESLPSWNQFAPAETTQPPTPDGDLENQGDVTMNVEVVNDDGDVELLDNVTYSCQAQPYTLTDNPQQIAMYSPDREILYAGGLIQGKSHRDGLGSLLGLPISERAPINVSIPGLANDDNFRTVERPNQANVDQAVGSMIGNATASGLSTPSSISFKMETYHSEKQSALQMGLSGNYLGFEGSASGSIDRNQSETTITAQFYQKMYEVVVEAPQSPGNFFSDDFTEARLQQQVNQGRIGPKNLPVYVSNIVYGRMMMFSLTSTASESDIRATMQAGYNSIGGSVEANMSAKQQSILSESKIKITSIGGDAEATLAMIRSGDWSQYFTEGAPLSSASPMSYTFRNLGDGSIASVSETTEYNVQTCVAKQSTPGTFNFSLAQELSLPVTAPATVLLGDVDGDGNQDIIYNHVSANLNETAVAFSNGDGTFTMSSTTTHSAIPADGWSQYELKVGDFDNDGFDDLAWGRVNVTNTTYIGLSKSDGTFQEMPVFTKGGSGWGNNYTFHIGNIDGIDGDDLIWNELASRNRTYVSLSNGNGTYGIDNSEGTTGTYQDHPSAGWNTTFNYRANVADFNGDGRDDIIWHTYRQSGIGGHRVIVAESMGDTPGTLFSFSLSTFDRKSQGWEPYEILIGDVDGNAGVDLAWVKTIDAPYVHMDLSTDSNPPITSGPGASSGKDTDDDYKLDLLDVNGDGRQDILLNRMSTVNRSFIGLGATDGSFDYSRVSQDHPQTEQWSQYQILTGDINGDSRDDIIYVNADASNTVYVGLARGNSQ